MSDRQNKVALVTGASRGMGRAAAIALASAGAHVLVHYNSNGQAADAVVAEISNRGGSAQTVSADLGTPDGPFGLSAAVRRIANGKIDIFVSNAGICRPLSLRNTTAEDFDEQFAVNVRAPFFLVQQLAPMMPSGGSIVPTSSLAARTTVGELSAYAASKGVISILVIQLAAELGKQGLRVNGIAPGIVATDMSTFIETKEGHDFTLGLQSIKRIATADDIAAVIAFLTSDAAGWITGDVIHVDGGSKL